jgi:hypothetical protein
MKENKIGQPDYIQINLPLEVLIVHEFRKPEIRTEQSRCKLYRRKNQTILESRTVALMKTVDKLNTDTKCSITQWEVVIKEYLDSQLVLNPLNSKVLPNRLQLITFIEVILFTSFNHVKSFL